MADTCCVLAAPGWPAAPTAWTRWEALQRQRWGSRPPAVSRGVMESSNSTRRDALSRARGGNCGRAEKPSPFRGEKGRTGSQVRGEKGCMRSEGRRAARGHRSRS